MCLVESARQIAGEFPSDFQAACGVVDAEVVAAELGRDQPAGTGYPTAHVEHRDPGADPGSAGEFTNLAGEHEALLTDVLPRRVGGLPRPFQSRHEGGTLILLHHEPLIRLSRVEHYLLRSREVGGSRRPIGSTRDEHALWPVGRVSDIECDEPVGRQGLLELCAIAEP